MGKTRRGHKEYEREQRLDHENQRLKREIGALRKQLARIDLDKAANVREILEKHYEIDKRSKTKDTIEKIRKEWECWECREGTLEINLYNRFDGTWYYRKCSNCTHRTKSQKYKPDIRGVLKSQNEADKDET